jgi:hypothetical protein
MTRDSLAAVLRELGHDVRLAADDKTSALKALDDLLRAGPSSATWVAVPAGEVATPSIERQVGRD